MRKCEGAARLEAFKLKHSMKEQDYKEARELMESIEGLRAIISEIDEIKVKNGRLPNIAIVAGTYNWEAELPEEAKAKIIDIIAEELMVLEDKFSKL